ncbi:MAG: prepilin-type N-terminal cleavage/methylation domain-containing protein [Polaromonas sp.]|nr:prepilin-type N-terminal cleavage/methylation domain-containing protein [Polaromonas sp.]
MAAPLGPARGFTLIELLVALAVMALLALLSWRGIDGMIRVQVDMRERMDGVVSLQTGLTQWSADLDAVFETGQVSGVDFDGRVLRLTRRDTTLADSPVRVVGWARRVIDGQHGGRGSWARWQSPPLRTRAELQEAWARVQLWAQNASEVEKRREVAVLGLEQWQIFYYRNDAWSNPLSTASAANTNTPTGAAASTGPTRSALAPLPDAIRLVLTLSPGQALTDVLTKDWIRPVLGGGKS